jgi:WhiB family redox-sensing transcriptional regulator
LDDQVLDLLRALESIEANRPAWHRRAACRGVGTHLFFIELGGSALPAKLLCSECEVSTECATFAVETEGTVGIWAGQSDRARQKLRNGRSVAV